MEKLLCTCVVKVYNEYLQLFVSVSDIFSKIIRCMFICWSTIFVKTVSRSDYLLVFLMFPLCYLFLLMHMNCKFLLFLSGMQFFCPININTNINIKQTEFQFKFKCYSYISLYKLRCISRLPLSKHFNSNLERKLKHELWCGYFFLSHLHFNAVFRWVSERSAMKFIYIFNYNGNRIFILI